MKKKRNPFEGACFWPAIAGILFLLVFLYFEKHPLHLDDLTCVGIGSGVVLLVFGYWIISGIINMRKRVKNEKALIYHRDRFYCHICGKPSLGPDWEGDTYECYAEDGSVYQKFWVPNYNKPNYNIPTGLVQCAKCQKWTCSHADPPHLENRVCKKCLENTPEQGIKEEN